MCNSVSYIGTEAHSGLDTDTGTVTDSDTGTTTESATGTTTESVTGKHEVYVSLYFNKGDSLGVLKLMQ
jgi:hypothetical protein